MVKYLSDTLDKPIKTVATWLILLLIFVFDPLAITLVIATNQAFKNLKPKRGIYREPKNPILLENETPGHRNPPPPPSPTNPNPKNQQIDKIIKSGYSVKKKKKMIKDIENSNSKEY